MEGYNGDFNFVGLVSLTLVRDLETVGRRLDLTSPMRWGQVCISAGFCTCGWRVQEVYYFVSALCIVKRQCYPFVMDWDPHTVGPIL